MHLKQIVKGSANAAGAYFARLRNLRKAHLYGVGTAKSGTHSIGSMFANTVRSRHEPESGRLIRFILDAAAGRISEEEVRRSVRARDRRLYLDVDSSQLNFFLLDILLDEFEDARFLLTIRDCYSWLDSFINDSLRRTVSREWTSFREFRFRADFFTHPPEEKVLRDMGLFTLDGYLSYWASHNQKVISSVPEDRLLIVRTDQITQRAQSIAEFAGLPREAIVPERSHAFKNPAKYGILRKIDRHHLDAKVEKYCAPLMSRFFPEINSLDDAGM